MPNLLPDFAPWVRPAGRLIEAMLVTGIGLGIVFLLMRRPKPAQPTTWAMAMAGAVGVFALFILAYAVVPHEWLTFANSYLKWSADKFIYRNKSTFPIELPYSALKDAIAAGIYIVFFGLNLVLWVMWQKRPTASPEGAEAAPAKVIGTSRFGRPLRAKA